MRIAPAFVFGLLLGVSPLLAQPNEEQDSEGSSSNGVSAPHRLEKRPPSVPVPEKPGTPPKMQPPKTKGIIPEGIRKGPNMINPLAPKEYGYGRRFMSKSAYTPHIPYSAGQTEVMTPGGGLELFTWEW